MTCFATCVKSSVMTACVCEQLLQNKKGCLRSNKLIVKQPEQNKMDDKSHIPRSRIENGHGSNEIFADHFSLLPVHSVTWNGVVAPTTNVTSRPMENDYESLAARVRADLGNNNASTAKSNGTGINMDFRRSDCLEAALALKNLSKSGSTRMASSELKVIPFEHMNFDVLTEEDAKGQIVEWTKSMHVHQYMRNVLETKAKYDMIQGTYDSLSEARRLAFWVVVNIDIDVFEKIAGNPSKPRLVCGCTLTNPSQVSNFTNSNGGKKFLQIIYIGVIVFGADCMHLFTSRTNSVNETELLITAVLTNEQSYQSFINQPDIHLTLMYERSLSSGRQLNQGGVIEGKIAPVIDNLYLTSRADTDANAVGDLKHAFIPLHVAVKPNIVASWTSTTSCRDLYGTMQPLKEDIVKIFGSFDVQRSTHFSQFLNLDHKVQALICSNAAEYWKLLAVDPGIIGLTETEFAQLANSGNADLPHQNFYRIASLIIFVKMPLSTLSCYTENAVEELLSYFTYKNEMMTTSIQAAIDMCPDAQREYQTKQKFGIESQKHSRTVEEILGTSKAAASVFGQDYTRPRAQNPIGGNTYSTDGCFGSGFPRKFTDKNNMFMDIEISHDMIGQSLKLAINIAASFVLHEFFEVIVLSFGGKVLERKFDVVHRPPLAHAIRDILVHEHGIYSSILDSDEKIDWTDLPKVVTYTLNHMQDTVSKVMSIVFGRAVMLHSQGGLQSNFRNHKYYEVMNFVAEEGVAVPPNMMIEASDAGIIRACDELIDWARFLIMGLGFIQQIQGEDRINNLAFDKGINLFLNPEGMQIMAKIRKDRMRDRTKKLFIYRSGNAGSKDGKEAVGLNNLTAHLMKGIPPSLRDALYHLSDKNEEDILNIFKSEMQSVIDDGIKYGKEAMRDQDKGVVRSKISDSIDWLLGGKTAFSNVIRSGQYEDELHKDKAKRNKSAKAMLTTKSFTEAAMVQKASTARTNVTALVSKFVANFTSDEALKIIKSINARSARLIAAIEKAIGTEKLKGRLPSKSWVPSLLNYFSNIKLVDGKTAKLFTYGDLAVISFFCYGWFAIGYANADQNVTAQELTKDSTPQERQEPPNFKSSQENREKVDLSQGYDVSVVEPTSEELEEEERQQIARLRAQVSGDGDGE